MGWIEFRQIKGLQVITDDALHIGNVLDMKYSPDSWKVKGLRISQTHSFEKIDPTIKGKVLLAPSNKYNIADVLLTKMPSSDMKAKVASDLNDTDLVTDLYGKKIMTSQGFFVGTVESVQMDRESWRIETFNVKLDKEAHKPLGIKKLLFSKSIKGVQTKFISSINKDEINLKLSIDELKKEIIIDE